MTNEEKAREIANLHKITYIAGLKNERGTSFIECMGSAYQMAEWKDQQYSEIIKEECNASYESGYLEGRRNAEEQFKEYLEKKKRSYDIYSDIINKHYSDAIEEIINELFGE